MSITIICLYIIFGMFIYLFFHYKFLKIFENTLLRNLFIASKESHERGIWSIPGPIAIPFVGTKWIFFWKYKMSQIHRAYEDFHRRYGPVALEVTPSGIPIVHLFARQAILPTLNVICNDFVEMLRSKRSNDCIVEIFQNYANLMGLEAVCTLMLGRRMGFMSNKPPEKARILAAAVKELSAMQRDSYYGFGLWKYFPTQTYRKFVHCEETIYNCALWN